MNSSSTEKEDIFVKENMVIKEEFKPVSEEHQQNTLSASQLFDSTVNKAISKTSTVVESCNDKKEDSVAMPATQIFDLSGKEFLESPQLQSDTTEPMYINETKKATATLFEVEQVSTTIDATEGDNDLLPPPPIIGDTTQNADFAVRIVDDGALLSPPPMMQENDILNDIATKQNANNDAVLSPPPMISEEKFSTINLNENNDFGPNDETMHDPSTLMDDSVDMVDSDNFLPPPPMIDIALNE